MDCDCIIDHLIHNPLAYQTAYQPALKIVVIVVLVYVGIVAAFESLIGYFQPRAGSVLVITTFDADGTAHDRVVTRLESSGQLYVAANDWPRAWYDRALEKYAETEKILMPIFRSSLTL